MGGQALQPRPPPTPLLCCGRSSHPQCSAGPGGGPGLCGCGPAGEGAASAGRWPGPTPWAGAGPGGQSRCEGQVVLRRLSLPPTALGLLGGHPCCAPCSTHNPASCPRIWGFRQRRGCQSPRCSGSGPSNMLLSLMCPSVLWVTGHSGLQWCGRSRDCDLCQQAKLYRPPRTSELACHPQTMRCSLS